LGWLGDIETEPENLSLEEVDWICIFTDGLVELANDLELDPFALLYRFNRGGNGFADLPFMPADDILILYYSVNPVTSKETVFEPILSEHYAGTEIDYIDHLQSTWRRSINFALGDRLGDRLYDLLICIREGMLNAFIHGCERSAEKFAHLQISVNEQENLVRVRIDDPGRGHQFDLKKRLEELSNESGKHLGLGIIQHLSDDFAIENEGTTLLFDMQIEMEEA
jgi:anti-sigma regulatory factor (Ser/Thr protein kinase)